jgi:hypothetical protein
VPRSFTLTVFRLVPPTSLPTPVSTTPTQDEPSLTQEKDLTLDAPTTTKSDSNSKSNALNRAFYTRLSARKTLLLTQTDLSGTFCIRFAVGAVRTEEKHVREAFDVLVEEAQATLREWRDE